MLVIGLFSTRTCPAFDYSLNPKFTARQNYYTNINMRSHPQQPIWLSVVSPGADLVMATENTELRSSFTWNQQFYLNNSSLNFDEQFFHMGYRSKQERFLWKLNGDYNNQSALTTEPTGVGAALRQVTKKYAFANPSVSYAFDSRNALELGYSFTDARYSQITNSFLADFDYHQVNALYTHNYSERSTFDLNLSGSRYHTPLSDQTVFNYIAQMGWQYQFSELFSFYVAGGVNYAQAEAHIPNFFIGRRISDGANIYLNSNRELTTDPTTNISNNALGEVYQVRLQRNLERGLLSLNFSQQQNPTAQGLQTRTLIATNNSFELSERWSAGFNANYQIVESTSQQSSIFNRTSYSLSPNLNWKWTPEVKFQLSYTYRQQKFQTADQPAEGHIAQLLLIYQPEINRLVK